MLAVMDSITSSMFGNAHTLEQYRSLRLSPYRYMSSFGERPEKSVDLYMHRGNELRNAEVCAAKDTFVLLHTVVLNR
jgi:hypothetical protein